MSRDKWVELGVSLLAYSVVFYVMLTMFRPPIQQPMTLTIVGPEGMEYTDAGFFRAYRDTFTVEVRP